MAEKEFMTYKGKPMVRCGDTIYYGDTADKYIVMLKINSTVTVDGNEVPEWQRYHDIMKREVQAGRATGQVSGYCFYDLSSLTRAAAAEEVANVTALFH